MTPSWRLLFAIIVALLLSNTGCERGNPGAVPTGNSAAASTPGNLDAIPIELYDNYVESGDLAAIEKRGRLRLLVDSSRSAALHREATQQDVEIEQARLMAHRLGLQLVVLEVPQFSDLIPMLNAGGGDLIANNLLVTDARRQKVDFSIPTAETDVVLVSATGTEDINDQSRLSGKVVVVTAGTVFEEEAQEFTRQYPGVELQIREDNYVDLLIEVADGDVDFTIVDRQALDLVLQFRDGLKANHVFPGRRELAWAIRKDSPELLQAINKQVQQIRMTRPGQRSVGDLQAIRKRGVLRAVTRNHPGTYFMWKGQVLGFEFRLLENFAKSLDVRLDITVADTHEDFVRMLRNGDVDVSASLLAVTRRRQASGMAFSRPYLQSPTGIAARAGEKLSGMQDLAGRTLCVRRASSQYQVAEELKKQVPGIEVQEVPGELDIQEVIDKVVNNECDLTIADEISVRLEQVWRDDIAFALRLPREESRYAWMVRESNPRLLRAINEFFAEPSTDDRIPELFERYFNAPKRTRDEIEELNRSGQLSPFDDIVRRYAEEFDFDWRLIVAQMYQESNFHPDVKSWVGARRLMQVIPSTGRRVGETGLFTPENSIRTGITYMRWLPDKFDDKGINLENQMWFPLAPYNAGSAHVDDAQDLARENGWDRRIWFDNVENAMLLLPDGKYFR
ncbi:transporter substrate-binding domain-containing protein [Microbulbifer sediminum]|uniref:transporter substrate-binding domain-containing protein n=1 Tax=Microbulbifer sediminum TaxID=2904250 RepID=UPI001F28EA68|nr:transporter substrate-binding domain-containing protein [Microbulbifer sediminum]